MSYSETAKNLNRQKRRRRRIRKRLRDAFGDHCYWCAGLMEFGGSQGLVKDIKEFATIEHHLAVAKGDRNQIMYLRLAHDRCNI